MLDGVLCEGCGEYLGEGAGHPRKCAGCRGFTTEPKDRPVREMVKCAQCHKRFQNAEALAQHQRDKHGASTDPVKTKAKVKNNTSIQLGGEPCPRCHMPTEVRQHVRITRKHLEQPFYYSKWFYCTNKNCRTTVIMPDRFRVFKSDGVGQ